MIRFNDYCKGLRRLDLRKVFESTVFGPIYTFKVGGQDIIDKIIYEEGTKSRVFKRSEFEKRLKIKCTRTKHYFTSLGALYTFLRSHKSESRSTDWINKNCPLIMCKDKIIVWSL